MWEVRACENRDFSLASNFLRQNRCSSFAYYILLTQLEKKDSSLFFDLCLILVGGHLKGLFGLSLDGNLYIQADQAALIDPVCESIGDKVLAQPASIQSLTGAAECVDLLVKRFVYWGVWQEKPSIFKTTCFRFDTAARSQKTVVPGFSFNTSDDQGNYFKIAADSAAKDFLFADSWSYSPIRGFADRTMYFSFKVGSQLLGAGQVIQFETTLLVTRVVSNSEHDETRNLRVMFQQLLNSTANRDTFTEILAFASEQESVKLDLLFDVGLAAHGETGYATM